MNEIETRLVPIRRRIRLRDGWSHIQRTIWAPAAAGFLIQLIGRLVMIPYLWIWTAVPLLLWIPAILIFHFVKPMAFLKTARRVDLELSLKERISTSLSFAPTPTEQQMNPLLARQHLDALNHINAIEPSREFPLLWLKKPLLAGAIMLAAAFLSGLIPNPMTARLQERRAIQQAVQEQAQQIQSFREEIAKEEQLSPEARDELIRKLDELAKALKENRGDLEQAIADLNRFEQDLRSAMDPELSASQVMRDSLAKQLANLADNTPSGSESLDPSESIETLLDQIEEMDEVEREQLSRELAQLGAQAAQAGDTSLGKALSALAQSIQDGDSASISSAAQNATSEFNRLTQALTDQAALQAALAQAQTTQGSLVQAGRQAAMQSSGNGQNPGQAAGQTPGQNPGQGQPGGGGGSKANTLPPATGGRTTLRSPQGDSPDASTGALDQSVYAPWQRSGASGEELFIPGQDSGQGQTTTTEGQGENPGLINPALVPYSEVFPQYLNAANQAMDTSYIPGNLIDYVRLYFASLEP